MFNRHYEKCVRSTVVITLCAHVCVCVCVCECEKERDDRGHGKFQGKTDLLVLKIVTGLTGKRHSNRQWVDGCGG